MPSGLFRIHKDELAIRPIWHHKGDRVQAHILVCFLAYALWKTLAQWMQRSGLGDAPRTLLDELAKIKSGDVVLPTQSVDGRPGRAGSATLRHNTRRGPRKYCSIGWESLCPRGCASSKSRQKCSEDFRPKPNLSPYFPTTAQAQLSNLG